MAELDFTSIRNHDGSRDNGFEELVCQLAHLSPPDNADYFVRKDGAGGDAGVECYWKLKNGSEHGWQAKYFLNSLESSQWTQISKSAETALRKHPDLTKYYVCLPRDWNDSRKEGKGGKPVESSWDKWEKHVKKWRTLAEKSGMKVEFVYWCKHELSLLLQRDEPQFIGRAQYWFNSPVLTMDVFHKLYERSRISLGERYTPESHLDLPIAKVFDGLARTKAWWEELELEINGWIKNINGFKRAVASIEKLSDEVTYESLQAEIELLSNALIDGVYDKSFLQNIELYKESFNELNLQLSHINEQFLTTSGSDKEKEEKRKRQDQFYKFESETYELSSFLLRNLCQVAYNRSLLLVGEAGIGKSHLLCDTAKRRLSESLPTLFLLGQHYQGGNPITSLKEAVDLNSISNMEFLGALDAAGEACGSNTLIIIDAINEGAHRDDWDHNLGGFLVDILQFQNLSVVLSCRNTFVNYLVQDELIENPLVRVTHTGFKGFEHRAATRYLSEQGISKPGAPILAPEFTNPLFLKTCCKAIKDSGQTAFPKGVHGISSLFEFYLNSMEQVIAKKKRYRTGDKVIKETLDTFSESLYPDHLYGLPLKVARQLINKCDPNPSYGDPLFDLLIHEGIFSEDIEFNRATRRHDNFVIRFTYERFSDHFVALYLAKEFSEESLEHVFKKGGGLESLFIPERTYGISGVLSALSIYVAEQFGREMIDLIPEKISRSSRLFDNLFISTLQWRTGDSFSKRTLELLNQVNSHGQNSHSIDILLRLSTEPEHPWNAEFLHQHLTKMTMPERDAFWSTYVAISDHEEEDYEEESVVRCLINWAHSGEIDQVEPERIRLCAIALMWMTSTTNKKVRDQAAKSAVRILSVYPEELKIILEKFYDVNDLYILERLYAVAYGVLTNIDDEQIIIDTADFIFKSEFAENNPTPHLLLRDYASGIMEFAFYKGLIEEHIDPSSFRPPYSSEWPLEDPSEEELNKLMGDQYSSAIRRSIMGFPGDFGNYTMGCVHKWSPTLIEDGKPQTGYELKCEFANILEDDLKVRFLSYLDAQKVKEKQRFDPANFLDQLEEVEIVISAPDLDKKPTDYDLLKDKIESTLTIKQKEHFRWVMGLGYSGNIGNFSRKKAQRWVCKRAIEFGWTKDLFEDFERHHTSKSGRGQHKIERIGKKYQWIAFYEFLAHLTDNCCYIDPGYSDADNSKYFGPWQIHDRNIDPSCWLRKTGDDGWYTSDIESWWQPFVHPFYGETLEELQEWLWDENLIPLFEKLLQLQDPSTDLSWIVLRSFANWKNEPKREKERIPYQDAWYRINSCVIHKDDEQRLIKALKGKNLCDPDIFRPNSTGHQGFLKEYPWHPVYKDMLEWDDYISHGFNHTIKHLVPLAEYEWESGSTDSSLDSSISIYLPAKELIESLNMSHDQENFGQWKDENNQILFLDPSVQQGGSSTALIRKKVFFDWLESNDLQLMWFVGGEKGLFSEGASKFYGQLIYSGIYKLSSEGISGNKWFIKQLPRE